MTQYIENTLRLINKENNFEKSNSKLAIEIYEDLIDFSAVYFTCYDNAKKSSIANGTKFKDELEKELKKQSSEFYQVVKKSSPNHLTAYRKLGKNPLTSKKVVKKKIEDCISKKKPIKFGTIRGMGSLLNEAPKEKTIEEVIQEFFKSTSKKYDCSNKKIIDTITEIFQADTNKKKIEDQQTQQLNEQKQVAEDLIKMGLAHNPNEKLDKILDCVNA